MLPRAFLTIAVAASLACAAAWAQDAPTGNSPQWLKSIEMFGHVSLAEMRARPDTILADFITDGCSGGMSSIWAIAGRAVPALNNIHSEQPPWENCCIIHDRAYHNAGPSPDPEASYANRLKADQTLKTCVEQTAKSRAEPLAAKYGLTPQEVDLAYSLISEAMFSAVRIGGQPCNGMPWRWGFGYPNCIITFN